MRNLCEALKLRAQRLADGAVSGRDTLGALL